MGGRVGDLRSVPPVRSLRATYRARVAGDAMTLNREPAPGGPEIAFTPFALVRGRPAEMPLCTSG